jgi:multiple sugar transport system ATP-binding protein
MRAGILQQVDSPRELYDNPRNIFVAGFIGSPAMNFFTGVIENNGITTPVGTIPLHDALRRSLEQHGSRQRDVVIGVRPEDFEDANFAPEGHEGWTFEAPIELTESMGSEIYAHFDFEQREALDSDELRELQQDAGTSDVPKSGASGHAVARVDAASNVKAGERSQLWLNTEKIHLFDPSDGHSMTRAGNGVGQP